MAYYDAERPQVRSRRAYLFVSALAVALLDDLFDRPAGPILLMRQGYFPVVRLTYFMRRA